MDFNKAQNEIETKMIITIPIFNDWESFSKLLKLIDNVLKDCMLTSSILAVDDGSTSSYVNQLKLDNIYHSIKKIEILSLGKNMGHQRAIAIALCHLNENYKNVSVLVMDSDGEDDPRDIPKLVNKMREDGDQKIIFAQRTKRSEALRFRIFYALYKKIFSIATGIKINFGNYCIIPHTVLHKIVLVSEIWSHFPAGILKAKILYDVISTSRSQRLDGKSKMNMISLFIHGCSALSVFSDVIAIRFLIILLSVSAVSVLAIAIIFFIRLVTNLAIPGWTSTQILLFSIILVQGASSALLFMFLILSDKYGSYFLPKRDYKFYINDIYKIYPLND